MNEGNWKRGIKIGFWGEQRNHIADALEAAMAWAEKRKTLLDFVEGLLSFSEMQSRGMTPFSFEPMRWTRHHSSSYSSIRWRCSPSCISSSSVSEGGNVDSTTTSLYSVSDFIEGDIENLPGDLLAAVRGEGRGEREWPCVGGVVRVEVSIFKVGVLCKPLPPRFNGAEEGSSPDIAYSTRGLSFPIPIVTFWPVVPLEDLGKATTKVLFVSEFDKSWSFLDGDPRYCTLRRISFFLDCKRLR